MIVAIFLELRLVVVLLALVRAATIYVTAWTELVNRIVLALVEHFGVLMESAQMRATTGFLDVK